MGVISGLESQNGRPSAPRASIVVPADGQPWSTFTGYYDENSGECRLRQRGSINAAGQYVEIPKPDVNVAFTTVVLGDKDCVSPVSLYEYSARESWLSDAQMATLTSKTCAAPADGDGDFVTSSCSACDTARAQGCHS